MCLVKLKTYFAIGLDEIPADIINEQGETGHKCIAGVFNRIARGEIS